MLDDATKMMTKRQGTDPSMPTAQMRGSACGNLSTKRLDKVVPKAPPRTPVATVTAPKIKLWSTQHNFWCTEIKRKKKETNKGQRSHCTCLWRCRPLRCTKVGVPEWCELGSRRWATRRPRLRWGKPERSRPVTTKRNFYCNQRIQMRPESPLFV